MNRLLKTRREEHPDLRTAREDRDRLEREDKKRIQKELKEQHKEDERRKKEEAEVRYNLKHIISVLFVYFAMNLGMSKHVN